MAARLGGSKSWVSWSTIVGAVVLVGCIIYAVYVYRSFTVCARESYAALTQFPGYGGQRFTPGPNYLDNPVACGARLSTTDDATEVLVYYQQQLTAHGWEVRDPTQELTESFNYDSLAAYRGELCYSASVEDYRGGSAEKGVYVSVNRADSCRPAELNGSMQR